MANIIRSCRYRPAFYFIICTALRNNRILECQQSAVTAFQHLGQLRTAFKQTRLFFRTSQIVTPLFIKVIFRFFFSSEKYRSLETLPFFWNIQLEHCLAASTHSLISRTEDQCTASGPAVKSIASFQLPNLSNRCCLATKPWMQGPKLGSLYLDSTGEWLAGVAEALWVILLYLFDNK